MSPSKVRELTDKVEELGPEISGLKRRIFLYENSPSTKNLLLYRELRRSRRNGGEGSGAAPREPGRKDGH